MLNNSSRHANISMFHYAITFIIFVKSLVVSLLSWLAIFLLLGSIILIGIGSVETYILNDLDPALRDAILHRLSMFSKYGDGSEGATNPGVITNFLQEASKKMSSNDFLHSISSNYLPRTDSFSASKSIQMVFMDVLESVATSPRSTNSPVPSRSFLLRSPLGSPIKSADTQPGGYTPRAIGDLSSQIRSSIDRMRNHAPLLISKYLRKLRSYISWDYVISGLIIVLFVTLFVLFPVEDMVRPYWHMTLAIGNQVFSSMKSALLPVYASLESNARTLVGRVDTPAMFDWIRAALESVLTRVKRNLTSTSIPKPSTLITSASAEGTAITAAEILPKALESSVIDSIESSPVSDILDVSQRAESIRWTDGASESPSNNRLLELFDIGKHAGVLHDLTACFISFGNAILEKFEQVEGFVSAWLWEVIPKVKKELFLAVGSLSTWIHTALTDLRSTTGRPEFSSSIASSTSLIKTVLGQSRDIPPIWLFSVAFFIGLCTIVIACCCFGSFGRSKSRKTSSPSRSGRCSREDELVHSHGYRNERDDSDEQPEWRPEYSDASGYESNDSTADGNDAMYSDNDSFEQDSAYAETQRSRLRSAQQGVGFVPPKLGGDDLLPSARSSAAARLRAADAILLEGKRDVALLAYEILKAQEEQRAALYS